MKNPIIHIAVLAAFAVLSFGQPLYSQSGDQIVIKKGKFMVNNQWVNKTWKLSSFMGALGRADKSKDGYNTTHTYDRKGIVLFEPKSPGGTVSEVQIYLTEAEPRNEITPEGRYTGKITIDKYSFNTSTSSATMFKRLKKWTKKDSYSDNTYRMSSAGMYIYFHFNADETVLQRLSIGPDTSE